MPAYPWLLSRKLDTNSLPARIRALRKVGVPYAEGFENGPAQQELEMQQRLVVANLQIGLVEADADREILALIAYLQRLGTDIKLEQYLLTP
jgi:cytochrome c oxidase cbb3-type subunit I/II